MNYCMCMCVFLTIIIYTRNNNYLTIIIIYTRNRIVRNRVANVRFRLSSVHIKTMKGCKVEFVNTSIVVKSRLIEYSINMKLILSFIYLTLMNFKEPDILIIRLLTTINRLNEFNFTIFYNFNIHPKESKRT